MEGQGVTHGSDRELVPATLRRLLLVVSPRFLLKR